MLRTCIDREATDHWADVYGTPNQDSVSRHWPMTTILYGWSSPPCHVLHISNMLALARQLADQVHAKFPLHSRVDTGLNYSLVEYPNVAVCQDLHGPCKPNVLLVRGLRARREAYSERKRRREDIHMGPSNSQDRSGPRRAPRCA